MRYRYYSNLFREMRKESEFRQRCCQNSTKVWERKRKSWREKIWNFGNGVTEIPTAQITWPSVCAVCSKCEVLTKKKGNCGNAIVETGREKKIVIAEIWGGIKKKSVTSTIFYNIFTTIHKWLVIISSYLNLTLRLLFFNLIITTCHLKFVVKIV